MNSQKGGTLSVHRSKTSVSPDDIAAYTTEKVEWCQVSNDRYQESRHLRCSHKGNACRKLTKKEKESWIGVLSVQSSGRVSTWIFLHSSDILEVVLLSTYLQMYANEVSDCFILFQISTESYNRHSRSDFVHNWLKRLLILFEFYIFHFLKYITLKFSFRQKYSISISYRRVIGIIFPSWKFWCMVR